MTLRGKFNGAKIHTEAWADEQLTVYSKQYTVRGVEVERGTVRDKSMKFAVRIVKLSKYLNEQKHEYVIAKQVLRSGTSIGANIAEAQQGVSRKSFAAKMSIALSEAAETKYWLELLMRTEYLTTGEYESIVEDCKELERMLTSIVKTAQKGEQ